MKSVPYLLCAAAALLSPACASAQLAVSAHDGKQLRPGEAPATRTGDEVVVIDLAQSPPRVLGTIAAPTSMIGPPASVAVAPDASFALVTAAQALEGGSIVKDGTVSVIDLADPAAPRVVQTLQAGSGASGVAINRGGTLALVASTGDDTIAVFTIAGKQLTRAGTVRLDYQSRPTDVTFAPDGRSALAVAQTANQIVRLAVEGTTVTRAGVTVAPGLSPYGAVVSRDGRYAYNTNLNGALPPPGTPGSPGGGGAAAGTISVIDLQANSVASSVVVGNTPEHVELSPDGRYLAVVVVNGSNAPETSPAYNAFGLLKIFRIDGSALVPAGEARTGGWCQGVAWSSDNRSLALQCAAARQIEVYRFDGAVLTRDDGATLTFAGRPGAISTAASR